MNAKPSFAASLATGDPDATRRERRGRRSDLLSDARVGAAVRNAGISIDPSRGDIPGQIIKEAKTALARKNGKRGGRHSNRFPDEWFKLMVVVRQLLDGGWVKSEAKACRIAVEAMDEDLLEMKKKQRSDEIKKRARLLQGRIGDSKRRARNGGVIAALFSERP